MRRIDWPDARIAVLHEDAFVRIVAKPAGLLVHNSAWAGPRERTLLDELGPGDWHAVHRIDRQTSGIVVVAKSPEAARAWQARLGAATKRYLALVRGVVRAPIDVDHALRDDDDVARPAQSRIEPLLTSAEARCSLVVVSPSTGRRHQVRRHAKHVAHPVIGDATHGKGPLNRAFAAQYGVARLALHAWRLDVDGLSLVAPLPDDLRGPLARIFGADALQVVA